MHQRADAHRLSRAVEPGQRLDLRGGDKAVEPGQPTLAIGVARAPREEVPVTFEYIGTIVSPKDAELQARVTGVVTERPFEPGSLVTKDQLLFQIDKRRRSTVASACR